MNTKLKIIGAALLLAVFAVIHFLPDAKAQTISTGAQISQVWLDHTGTNGIGFSNGVIIVVRGPNTYVANTTTNIVGTNGINYRIYGGIVVQ